MFNLIFMSWLKDKQNKLFHENVYFCRNATKQLMRVLKIYKTTAVTHGFYVYNIEHFNLNL